MNATSSQVTSKIRDLGHSLLQIGQIVTKADKLSLYQGVFKRSFEAYVNSPLKATVLTRSTTAASTLGISGLRRRSNS